MKKLQKQVVISEKHIDAGDHANWIAQQTIAQDLHFELRDQLGFGLKQLEKQGLLLVINKTEGCYFEPLKCGDTIDTTTTMIVRGGARLEVEVKFGKNGQLTTRLKWMMATILIDSGKPCRLPKKIIEAVVPTTKKRPRTIGHDVTDVEWVQITEACASCKVNTLIELFRKNGNMPIDLGSARKIVYPDTDHSGPDIWSNAVPSLNTYLQKKGLPFRIRKVTRGQNWLSGHIQICRIKK